MSGSLNFSPALNLIQRGPGEQAHLQAHQDLPAAGGGRANLCFQTVDSFLQSESRYRVGYAIDLSDCIELIGVYRLLGTRVFETFGTSLDTPFESSLRTITGADFASE